MPANGRWDLIRRLKVNACCPLVTAFWDRMSQHLVSTDISAE